MDSNAMEIAPEQGRMKRKQTKTIACPPLNAANTKRIQKKPGVGELPADKVYEKCMNMYVFEGKGRQIPIAWKAYIFPYLLIQICSLEGQEANL